MWFRHHLCILANSNSVFCIFWTIFICFLPYWTLISCSVFCIFWTIFIWFLPYWTLNSCIGQNRIFQRIFDYFCLCFSSFLCFLKIISGPFWSFLVLIDHFLSLWSFLVIFRYFWWFLKSFLAYIAHLNMSYKI